MAAAVVAAGGSSSASASSSGLLPVDSAAERPVVVEPLPEDLAHSPEHAAGFELEFDVLQLLLPPALG